MLVLSRRLYEKIVFPQINATVQVTSIKPGVVRLGIQAPPEISVLRAELPDRNQQWGTALPAAPEQQTLRCNEVIKARLQINQGGLAILRRQLEAGNLADAKATLARIEEDLQLLRGRLGASPEPPAERPVRQQRFRRPVLVG